MTAKTRVAVLFVMACFLTAAFLLLHTDAAQPRPRVPADVFKAVRANWTTRPERVKAFDVISCETGGRYNTTARNGQYLGLFQMGSFARARYGHGSSAFAQARAAHRYYVDAGWGPWSCA
jgi:hypothetical protein